MDISYCQDINTVLVTVELSYFLLPGTEMSPPSLAHSVASHPHSSHVLASFPVQPGNEASDLHTVIQLKEVT